MAAVKTKSSTASPRVSIQRRASHAQTLQSSKPWAMSRPLRRGRGRTFMRGGPPRRTPQPGPKWQGPKWKGPKQKSREWKGAIWKGPTQKAPK
eukprot:scaffold14142_cov94-Isochrysis_galbana.AAC.7